MAEKKSSTRKKKVEKFKEEAKKQAAVAAQPRTHMVPQTEWQSKDNLDLRGDLAEALENQLVAAYQALTNAGQIFSQFMQANIASGKAKVTYIWNTGEIPTPEEQQKWVETMEMVQKQREAQLKAMQEGLAGDDATNTVLETVGGRPLTEENLEKEKGAGLIIVP